MKLKIHYREKFTDGTSSAPAVVELDVPELTENCVLTYITMGEIAYKVTDDLTQE